MKTDSSTETAVLGGGCFWCLEAAYQQVNGVTSVKPGYAGGHDPMPTYERVSTGNTGHAEVVEITYDPGVISFADLLDIFWGIHNPTTPNRQGNDVGTQYRSMILYSSDEQAKAAEQSRKHAQTLWPDLIVTDIKPLDHFYPAEEYHHNYFQKNPSQAYCQIVINPKLHHLREKFSDRLKPEFR